MVTGGAGSVFAWTLVHSVWQGALVAGVLWLVLRIVPGSMTRVRTAAASAALAVVLGLGMATWVAVDADWGRHDACWSSEAYALDHPANCASHGVPLPSEVLGLDAGDEDTRVILPWAWISPGGIPAADAVAPAALSVTGRLTVVMIAWLALALVALTRLGTSLALLRGVVRRARPVEEPGPRALLRDLARRAGVSRPVALRESDELTAPAVAGWRCPLVLLPAGMCETLERGQLACVLAHELVHIERGHFALNLGQRVLECLLVANPGVLWISRRIREEREVLCDRAAAGAPAGERRDYVETLLRLESLRAPADPALLIGLLGEGPLLRRVRRLLDAGAPRRRERLGRGLAAGVVGALALSAIVHASVAAMAVSSWAVMERDIHVRKVPAYEMATPPGEERAPVGTPSR